MCFRMKLHRCPKTRATVIRKKSRCPKIPSTVKPVNGKHRQRVFRHNRIVTLLNEIDRLSDGRREDKLLLVRQSVANSWKSVFPLKGGGAPAPAAPVSPERFGWD